MIWGWKHKALVDVCSTLVAMYALVFVAMLVTQRIARLRTLGDYLEDHQQMHSNMQQRLTRDDLNTIRPFHSVLLADPTGRPSATGTSRKRFPQCKNPYVY